MVRKKGFFHNLFGASTTKQVGDDAENLALTHLQSQGLRLIECHYRTRGRGGGEIDLVMRDGQTLVFVEVRARRSVAFGAAAATVDAAKQKRIVFAATQYVQQFSRLPPCRFDVVTVEPDGTGQGLSVHWLKAAFDAA